MDMLEEIEREIRRGGMSEVRNIRRLGRERGLVPAMSREGGLMSVHGGEGSRTSIPKREQRGSG